MELPSLQGFLMSHIILHLLCSVLEKQPILELRVGVELDGNLQVT